MTNMTSIPVDDSFTADDLDSLPDDGQRYELVDGELLVTPSPRMIHQVAVLELAHVLRAAVPAGLRVLVAPMDVRLSMRLQVQPDVLVIHDGPLDVPRVEEVPLLVVEVLSRTTRSRDLVTKRRAYEGAGIPSYWLVDPKVPSLTVLELVEGSYREVATARGDEAFRASRPFAVEVVPAALAG
jgi:Uma2 family endonuclease